MGISGHIDGDRAPNWQTVESDSADLLTALVALSDAVDDMYEAGGWVPPAVLEAYARASEAISQATE